MVARSARLAEVGTAQDLGLLNHLPDRLNIGGPRPGGGRHYGTRPGLAPPCGCSARARRDHPILGRVPIHITEMATGRHSESFELVEFLPCERGGDPRLCRRERRERRRIRFEELLEARRVVEVVVVVGRVVVVVVATALVEVGSVWPHEPRRTATRRKPMPRGVEVLQLGSRAVSMRAVSRSWCVARSPSWTILTRYWRNSLWWGRVPMPDSLIKVGGLVR